MMNSKEFDQLLQHVIGQVERISDQLDRHAIEDMNPSKSPALNTRPKLFVIEGGKSARNEGLI
ncbi:hypothetical protein [Echinimonas agarilytica]|uniref:Uncharacterized protein n=1 Tax=Echinimonas agarilytica TaxID=1215918 RepID=A0AA41W553_9GAMM|nr:hypothetical protein [Echinimonas agarilytica]MCM2678869.1 hypothetical protein [Echinimonas agarilytica]